MSQFLILPLLVIGYFIVLGVVLNHSDPYRSIVQIALSVLLIYGMVIGGILIFATSLGDVGLLLYASAIVYSIAYIGYSIFMGIKKGFHKKSGIYFALLGYLLAVFYITTFIRTSGTNGRMQMQLFDWISHDVGSEDALHMVLNIIMFIPVGLLHALSRKEMDHEFLQGMSFGLVLSVCIETIQLLAQSGTCDIDDILANALGAVIGVIIIISWTKWEEKRHARSNG